MPTTRHAAIGASLAVALIACEGSSSEPPRACVDCDPTVGRADGQGLVVENRTDHPVSITTRTFTALSIDRKVLEGTLVVPIGPARRGTDQSLLIQPGTSTFFGSGINVVNGSDVRFEIGGGVRIGSGPFFLAVGKGVLVMRTRDGADILEAEDPRAVVLLPVERDVTACAAGTFGEMLDGPSPPVAYGDPLDVESIARDADGCRVFRFAGNGVDDFRLCVPDAAFPFVEDEAISMTSNGRGARFENATGTVLEILPAEFRDRSPAAVSDVRVAFSEQTTCASDDAKCGSVGVPAKVLFSFDGKTSQTLAVGDSIIDPNDATRTFFVIGARSLPVADVSCATQDGEGIFNMARVVLALVERPVP